MGCDLCRPDRLARGVLSMSLLLVSESFNSIEERDKQVNPAAGSTPTLQREPRVALPPSTRRALTFSSPSPRLCLPPKCRLALCFLLSFHNRRDTDGASKPLITRQPQWLKHCSIHHHYLHLAKRQSLSNRVFWHHLHDLFSFFLFLHRRG